MRSNLGFKFVTKSRIPYRIFEPMASVFFYPSFIFTVLVGGCFVGSIAVLGESAGESLTATAGQTAFIELVQNEGEVAERDVNRRTCTSCSQCGVSHKMIQLLSYLCSYVK